MDLDAHGDGLVAGDAALGETEFGPTWSISAIHISFATYSLHIFRVLRHACHLFGKRPDARSGAIGVPHGTRHVHHYLQGCPLNASHRFGQWPQYLGTISQDGGEEA